MESTSPTITVSSEYEVVMISVDGREVVVGDHYGDPAGTILDEKKRWIASYGEGVQLYFIREPLEPYVRSNQKIEEVQWTTWGISFDQTVFIERAKQTEEGFELKIDGEDRIVYLTIDYLNERLVEQGTRHNADKSAS